MINLKSEIQGIAAALVDHGYQDRDSGIVDPTKECKESFEEYTQKLLTLFSKAVDEIIEGDEVVVDSDHNYGERYGVMNVRNRRRCIKCKLGQFCSAHRYHDISEVIQALERMLSGAKDSDDIETFYKT